MAMPTFVVPPLVKIVIAAVGGIAALRWGVKEIRRMNAELDRVRTAPTMDAVARRKLPTLRRDPASGEWRVV
jgi:hypothetical protein